MKPRQYAHEILCERDLEKRRAMLENVPENLRALVKTHVINAVNLRGWPWKQNQSE